MNLRQLEYFKAIAEERQITAAAKRLHITQPPLSYELASLERELGTKLVERSSRGTELTDAGRVLYDRACQMLDLAEATKREVGNVGRGLAGTLSLGLISSSGGQVPNGALLELTKSYPDVQFQIREGSTYEVLDMLRRGVVELGVVRMLSNQDEFECRMAQPEPMAALMPPEYVCGSADDVVTLAELADQPLVIYRRYEKVLTNLFAAQSLDHYFACVMDDARTTCVWASRGVGIGLVPTSFLQLFNVDEFVVKRVDEEALYTRMGVVWPKGRRLSPLAERFVDLLWEGAGE